MDPTNAAVFGAIVLAMMAAAEWQRRRALRAQAEATRAPLPTQPAVVVHFAKGGRRQLVIQRRTSKFPTYVGW